MSSIFVARYRLVTHSGAILCRFWRTVDRGAVRALPWLRPCHASPQVPLQVEVSLKLVMSNMPLPVAPRYSKCVRCSRLGMFLRLEAGAIVLFQSLSLSLSADGFGPAGVARLMGTRERKKPEAYYVAIVITSVIKISRYFRGPP